MSKTQEALKLALEALEQIDEAMPFPVAKFAQAAIREALAEQPAQQDSTCNKTLREQGKAYPRTCKKCGLGPCIADRVQPHKQQEPVAEVKLKERGGNAGIATVIHEIYDPMREPLRVGDKLYTTPPASKPWVGLTEDDANKIYKDGSTFGEMMRMVEAKLREKNA